MSRLFLVWILLFGMGFGADATIDLVKTIQKIPTIQVTYLDNKYADEAMKVYKVLLGDLNVSGHFLVQEGQKGKARPNYSEFLGNKIDLLVNIQAQKSDDGYKFVIKLFDINAQDLILDKAYSIDDAKLYPFVAHKIAIDINDYIKAPSINWMKRYIVLSTYAGPAKTHIVISDYTLTYKKVIINEGLNIFPKWADAQQTEIYFTKFINNTPVIVRYNIYTGISSEILKSDGMAIVSSVSKDSKKLLLTLAPIGDPDLFLFDVEKKKTLQLTKYRGIDVSGSFVEDDGAMIFVSDRLGYPNVFYKKLEENAPVEQVVYHGKNNSSVSSYKDYVVYSSRETSNDFGSNTFNLYLISTKNDFIRRLTANGLNQSPRFSSDGGSIMFIKSLNHQSALGIIRLDYNKTYLFPLKNIQIQSFDW